MNEQKRISFQFMAPAGQEQRAIEILQGLGNCVDKLAVLTNPQPHIVMDQETGKVSVSYGYGILGQALPECVEEMMRQLSAAEIQGYVMSMPIYYAPEVDDAPTGDVDINPNQLTG